MAEPSRGQELQSSEPTYGGGLPYEEAVLLGEENNPDQPVTPPPEPEADENAEVTGGEPEPVYPQAAADAGYRISVDPSTRQYVVDTPAEGAQVAINPDIIEAVSGLQGVIITPSLQAASERSAEIRNAPPPTEAEMDAWTTFAQEAGIDPMAYAQAAWLQARGITPSDLRQAGVIMPGVTENISPEFRQVFTPESQFQMKQAAQRIEERTFQQIVEQDPELAEIYRKGGVDAYNQAIDQRIAEWERDVLPTTPPEYQEAYAAGNEAEMNRLEAQYQREYEEYLKQQETLDELERFKIQEIKGETGEFIPELDFLSASGYDLVQALRTGYDRDKLVNVFGSEAVKNAEKYIATPVTQLTTESGDIKKWIDVDTGIRYTDAEREALIADYEAKRAELTSQGVPAPGLVLGQHPGNTVVPDLEGVRQSYYDSQLYDALSFLPRYILEEQPIIDISSKVTNESQKKLLQTVDGIVNFGLGLTAGSAAMFTGLPLFAVSMAVDPVGTGKGVITGITESALSFGRIYKSAFTAGPMTDTQAAQYGVDTAVLVWTALALKAGVKSAKSMATKALKDNPAAYNRVIKAISTVEAAFNQSYRNYGGRQLMLAEVKPSKGGNISAVADTAIAEILRANNASEQTIKSVIKWSDVLAEAIDKANKPKIEQALKNIDAALAKSKVDPYVKEMIMDGGRNIAANADTLLKTVDMFEKVGDVAKDSTSARLSGDWLEIWRRPGQPDYVSNPTRAYRLTINDINNRVNDLAGQRWGDAVNELRLIRDDIYLAKETNTTLSDSLSRSVDWYAKKAPETTRPNWLAAEEETIYLNRLQKLIDRMPQTRRTQLNRALERGGEARVEALREMWEYLEEVYGKRELESYMKTGQWEGGVPEGLEGSIKGTKEAAEIVDKLKEAREIENDLDAALREIDQILRENNDKPAGDILPKPKETGRGGTATATKTKPKTEVTTEKQVRETPVESAPAESAARTRPKTSESVFPGIKTKTAESIFADTMPITYALAQTLPGYGLKVARPSVTTIPSAMPLPMPMEVTTPAPSPYPAVAPMPTPQPSPAPAPAPAPAPSPSPAPQPQPVPEPSPQPQPQPTPSPMPLPQPTPAPYKAAARPIIRPKLIKKSGGSTSGRLNRQRIDEGSIAWKQGALWKWIPPDDFKDGVKPRTLPRGYVPDGAVLRGRTPAETIQVIGGNHASVPNQINVDLGISDAFISNNGRRIVFGGRGRRTDVGKRLGSTTSGMSVGGEADVIMIQEYGEYKKTKLRPRKSNRKSKRLRPTDTELRYGGL